MAQNINECFGEVRLQCGRKIVKLLDEQHFCLRFVDSERRPFMVLCSLALRTETSAKNEIRAARYCRRPNVVACRHKKPKLPCATSNPSSLVKSPISGIRYITIPLGTYSYCGALVGVSNTGNAARFVHFTLPWIHSSAVFALRFPIFIGRLFFLLCREKICWWRPPQGPRSSSDVSIEAANSSNKALLPSPKPRKETLFGISYKDSSRSHGTASQEIWSV
jgi:hypothetical protein